MINQVSFKDLTPKAARSNKSGTVLDTLKPTKSFGEVLSSKPTSAASVKSSDKKLENLSESEKNSLRPISLRKNSSTEKSNVKSKPATKESSGVKEDSEVSESDLSAEDVAAVQAFLFAHQQDLELPEGNEDVSIEMIEKFKNQQGDIKKNPVQGFMEKMESKYGIKPEQILNAFSKMDPAALSATPEQSANAFLNGLGLDQDQKADASKLYQQMVQETGKASVNEKMAVNALAEMQPQIAEAFSGQVPVAASAGAGLNDATPVAAKPQSIEAVAEQYAGQGGSAAPQQNLPDAGNSQGEAGADLADKGSSFDTALKGDSTKVDADNVSYQSVAAQQNTGSTASALGAAAAAPQAALSPEDQAGNIKDIIRQAQVLIKKGGGEMKLEMSPEGMGKVNLQVAVQNGQVSIQMTADNDKTRKAMEDGLQDLKTSLATHNLKVDNVKVELADGIQKFMDQSLSDQKDRGHEAAQDRGQEKARDAASNFLGNMRDERQGMREGLYDAPGFRAYRQNPARRAEMNPAVSSADMLARTDAKRNIGAGRLNLVA